MNRTGKRQYAIHLLVRFFLLLICTVISLYYLATHDEGPTPFRIAMMVATAVSTFFFLQTFIELRNFGVGAVMKKYNDRGGR